MEPSTDADALARARAAISHLRATNDLLAEAHRFAANDAGENFIRNENSPRNNRFVSELVRTWNDAELEFRRACALMAPTIDCRLRLADIESIGELINSGAVGPAGESTGLVAQVSSFDLHVHELFVELQRTWPELASEAPLAEHQADYDALRSPWRLALERRPLTVLSFVAIVVYVIGGILWQTISQM